MKLSELSYREYIALEVLPSVIAATAAGQHRPGAGYATDAMTVDERICSDAFRLADAFMRVVGKENDKIFRAEQRAIDAETKFEALQSIHVNMGEDFAARIALTSIWEFLGVCNQTQAMQALRGDHRSCNENSFRAGFAAGHQFGLGTTMRCNEHSDGADRAWKAYSDD